ncbi:MAG TPA: hypothetical protein V6C96_05675, partial [Vampirovibrionales bacterium]
TKGRVALYFYNLELLKSLIFTFCLLVVLLGLPAKAAPHKQCLNAMPFKEQLVLKKCLFQKKTGMFEGQCLALLEDETRANLTECIKNDKQQNRDKFKDCVSNLSFNTAAYFRLCMVNVKKQNFSTEKSSTPEEESKLTVNNCIENLPEEERAAFRQCTSQ